MRYIVFKCDNCHYTDLLIKDDTRDLCPVCGEIIYDAHKGKIFNDMHIIDNFKSPLGYWSVYEIIRKIYYLGFSK